MKLADKIEMAGSQFRFRVIVPGLTGIIFPKIAMSCRMTAQSLPTSGYNRTRGWKRQGGDWRVNN